MTEEPMTATATLTPATDEPIILTDEDMVLDRHANNTGVNIGSNTVTRCTEHLPDDQKLLVRWLHTYARDKKWDWSNLCAEVKLDHSTLWRVWNDTYRTPTHKYVGKGDERKKV